MTVRPERFVPDPQRDRSSIRRSGSIPIGLAAVVLGLLAGCASVPDVDPRIGQTGAATMPPQILGTQGPLLAGNGVAILRDGPVAFRAIFAAIAGAKTQIDIEYFILEDVTSDGLVLGDLLAAKLRDGVAVNVIYDSYGTSGTPAEFFTRLRQAGANLVDFNPINPLEAGGSYAPDHRDHRKILVVDGAIAIIGGVNLSTDYESNPLARSNPRTGPATQADGVATT